MTTEVERARSIRDREARRHPRPHGVSTSAGYNSREQAQGPSQVTFPAGLLTAAEPVVALRPEKVHPATSARSSDGVAEDPPMPDAAPSPLG